MVNTSTPCIAPISRTRMHERMWQPSMRRTGGNTTARTASLRNTCTSNGLTVTQNTGASLGPTESRSCTNCRRLEVSWRNFYTDQRVGYSGLRSWRTPPKIARTWSRRGDESSGATGDCKSFFRVFGWAMAAALGGTHQKTNSQTLDATDASTQCGSPSRMPVGLSTAIQTFTDSCASRWRNGIAIQSPTTYETKIAANIQAQAGGVPEMNIGRNTVTSHTDL